MSPLANQGMLQQNNMLLQGRSPNNMQQMMGIQMPVGPNMQLFNTAGIQTAGQCISQNFNHALHVTNRHNCTCLFCLVP